MAIILPQTSGATPLLTSQPTMQIFKQLFRRLQFATAIDFAEAAHPRKAWQALHLTPNF